VQWALLGSFRVVLRLLQREPAEDTHKLMSGRSIVSRDDSTRLPQSGGGALRKTRLVAAIPEPVAELGDRKWPSLPSQQERQVANWRGINDGLERGQHRELETDRLPAAILRLSEARPSVSYVLATKEDTIRAPLPCVKWPTAPWCQRGGAPRIAHFCKRPRVETTWLAFEIRHVASGVLKTPKHFFLD